MRTRLVISLIVLGAFILLPQAVLADDLADLKATHMSYMEAFHAGDAETFMGFWVEGGVFFLVAGPFPQ